MGLIIGGFSAPVPTDGGKGKKIEDKTMHPEIWKRWLVFAAIMAAIAIAVSFGPALIAGIANASAIFAITATDVSVIKPPSGVENPLVIGTATPAPTEGKETTAAYVPKYYPNGPANLGNDIQEVALNNLPEKLLIAGRGIVFIKDLKIEGNYLYGYLGSTIDIDDEDVRIVFLDKNGNPTVDHLVNSLSFGRYNEQTKQSEFAEIGSSSGIRNLKKGIEIPFRVPIPKGAVYIQTIRM